MLITVYSKLTKYKHNETYHILKGADTLGGRRSLHQFGMLPQAALCLCKSFHHHWRCILLRPSFRSCMTLVLNCSDQHFKEWITVIPILVYVQCITLTLLCCVLNIGMLDIKTYVHMNGRGTVGLEVLTTVVMNSYIFCDIAPSSQLNVKLPAS
jgi:hypothetical protein